MGLKKKKLKRYSFMLTQLYAFGLNLHSTTNEHQNEYHNDKKETFAHNLLSDYHLTDVVKSNATKSSEITEYGPEYLMYLSCPT